MLKIKMLENYQNYKQGNTYTINQNEAQLLINEGFAEIYYHDKMMRSKHNKHFNN